MNPLHRHRWYVTGVEHLAPAAGQDPPHGWSIVKRACWAGRCAELGASVLAGRWTLGEARGMMPWATARPPARAGVPAGGLGAVARQRAADPYAVPGLPVHGYTPPPPFGQAWSGLAGGQLEPGPPAVPANWQAARQFWPPLAGDPAECPGDGAAHDGHPLLYGGWCTGAAQPATATAPAGPPWRAAEPPGG